MRKFRKIVLFLWVIGVLFASVPFSAAIGFEAEKAYESVFVIYSGSALGSGFALGENCIVTNAHVIENPGYITVETYGGEQYRASLLGMDEYADIAVLAVKDASFSYLEVADISQMRTGDDIYAIGAPKGMAYTLTKGGISAKERQIANQTYIQIDAAINEGNSGGPLLNDAGQVLGMNTLKMSDSEGIGLAIPITRVCEYLENWGISLDEKGNVSQKVIASEDSGIIQPPKQDTEETPGTTRVIVRTPAITWIAIGVAVVSLLGNALLAALLIKAKRNVGAPPADPSERTDFDIDILE